MTLIIITFQWIEWYGGTIAIRHTSKLSKICLLRWHWAPIICPCYWTDIKCTITTSSPSLLLFFKDCGYVQGWRKDTSGWYKTLFFLAWPLVLQNIKGWSKKLNFDGINKHANIPPILKDMFLKPYNRCTQLISSITLLSHCVPLTVYESHNKSFYWTTWSCLTRCTYR